MNKRLSQWSGISETMLLALVVWLCSLVAIGLIVLPLFGLRVAVFVAAGLLIVLLAICWGICAHRVARNRGQR